MKFLVILFPLVAIVAAVRSPYAGNKPVGVPELAYRFREESTTVDVGNRLGEGTGPTTTTTTTERVSIDDQLLAWILTWPRENQPFDVVNRQAIAEHTGQRQPTADVASRFGEGETIPAKPTQNRSPFAGSSRV